MGINPALERFGSFAASVPQSCFLLTFNLTHFVVNVWSIFPWCFINDSFHSLPCLSVCQSACMRMWVCVCICLFVCLSVCLHVCLSTGVAVSNICGCGAADPQRALGRRPLHPPLWQGPGRAQGRGQDFQGNVRNDIFPILQPTRNPHEITRATHERGRANNFAHSESSRTQREIARLRQLVSLTHGPLLARSGLSRIELFMWGSQRNH